MRPPHAPTARGGVPAPCRNTRRAAQASPEAGQVVIDVAVSAGTTTMFICGELDLVTMPFLSEQLAQVLADRPGRLVLDLTRTDFLDCGSARLIVAAGRSLASGRRPVIRHPRPGVRRILELTGLAANCEIEG